MTVNPSLNCLATASTHCKHVTHQSGSFLYKMLIQTPNYKCALNLHLVCSSALECITTCEYDSMVLVLRFSFTQPWIPREFYFVDFLEITLECQSQVNNSLIDDTSSPNMLKPEEDCI